MVFFKKLKEAASFSFFRKKLEYYDFFSGTTNWKDCVSVILSLLKFDGLQNGRYIEKYEELSANYHGLKYAFSFASGRMSLYAILKSLGIGRDDEVILPAYNCVVCPNAILYTGAKPIYVDIDKETFNIDPKKIEEKITKKTKAIMVQHTFGFPCDMDKIQKISNKHHIPIIEDCAHALGGEYKGKKLGSIGIASFFSSDHTKIISTSTGGMVLTDDEELAKKIKKIYMQSPFLPKLTILRVLFTFISENFLWNPHLAFIGRWIVALFWKFPFFFFLDENKIQRPTNYPYPARLSNIQAKIGIRQMEKLEINISFRRKISKEYDKIFDLYKEQFENNTNTKKHTFLRYTFLINDLENIKYFRNKYRKYVYLGDWFNSISHGRTDSLDKINYTIRDCPIAEYVSRHNVNLPTHQKINDTKIMLELANELLKSKAIIKNNDIQIK